MWSMFSVLFMIGGIGLLAWHYAVWHGKEAHAVPPARDPLAGLALTPSMRATAKYFWLVVALFLVQILLGATTAKELFPDEEPLGQVVRIANVPFTVVGVLGEKGQAAASGRDQDDVALMRSKCVQSFVGGHG